MWTVSHHESDTRYLEVYDVPDIVNFLMNLKYLQDTDLRLLGS